MDDPSYFLGEAHFCKRDTRVKDAANYIMDNIYRKFASEMRNAPEDEIAVRSVESFINGNYENMGKMGRKHGKSRTVSDMLKGVEYEGGHAERGLGFRTGHLYNCIDIGLLESTLLRGLGVPSKYMETFWKGEKKYPFTHIMLQVLGENGEWRVVDPCEGKKRYNIITHEGRLVFDGQTHYIMGEGLDFSCLEVPGQKDSRNVPDTRASRDAMLSVIHDIESGRLKSLKAIKIINIDGNE
jgi:hypothetical protein